MKKESKIKTAAVFAVALMLAVCFAGIFVSEETKAEGEFTCQILVSEHGELTATAGGESYGTGATIEGLSEGDVITFNADASVGYSFSKLDSTGSDVAPTIDGMTVTMGAGNAKIVGVFEPVPETTYKVTFENATGGTAEASKTTEIKFGEVVKLTAKPEKDFKFGTWRLADGSNSYIQGDELTVMGDCKITPVFVKSGEVPFYLTLGVNGKGMALAMTDFVEKAGGVLTIGATPSAAEGYVFDHWELVSGDGCVIEDAKSEITDVKMNDQCRINAVFVKSDKPIYMIEISSTDSHGTLMVSKTAAFEGEVVTLSVKDVQEGWMVKGYKIVEADKKSKIDGNKLTVNDSVTIQAIYAECYYITFDTQGGKEIERMAVEPEWIIGKEITLPKAEKKDYIFKGWFTAAEGGEEVSGMVTANMTVYAHWEKATITENTAMIVGVGALVALAISIIAMIAGFRHPVIYLIAVVAAILVVVAVVFYVGWIKF